MPTAAAATVEQQFSEKGGSATFNKQFVFNSRYSCTERKELVIDCKDINSMKGHTLNTFAVLVQEEQMEEEEELYSRGGIIIIICSHKSTVNRVSLYIAGAEDGSTSLFSFI